MFCARNLMADGPFNARSGSEAGPPFDLVMRGRAPALRSESPGGAPQCQPARRSARAAHSTAMRVPERSLRATEQLAAQRSLRAGGRSSWSRLEGRARPCAATEPPKGSATRFQFLDGARRALF